MNKDARLILILIIACLFAYVAYLGLNASSDQIGHQSQQLEDVNR